MKEKSRKFLDSSDESGTEENKEQADEGEKVEERVTKTKGTKRRSAFMLNSDSEDEEGVESKRTRVEKSDENSNILKVSVRIFYSG